MQSSRIRAELKFFPSTIVYKRKFVARDCKPRTLLKLIIITALRSYKLETLQQTIAEYNKTSPEQPWAMFELERFDIAGIPISRIALLCDEMPPAELSIPIEAVFETPQYCPYCFEQGQYTKLADRNKYGVCRKHQDKLQHRTQRKRKK